MQHTAEEEDGAIKGSVTDADSLCSIQLVYALGIQVTLNVSGILD